MLYKQNHSWIRWSLVQFAWQIVFWELCGSFVEAVFEQHQMEWSWNYWFKTCSQSLLETSKEKISYPHGFLLLRFILFFVVTGSRCSRGRAEAVQLIHSQQNKRTKGFLGREAGKGQMQMKVIKESNISGAVARFRETLQNEPGLLWFVLYPSPHVQAWLYLSSVTVVLQWASVLLSEGRWFYSPGLHVKVPFGEILNPKLVLVCWSAACMCGLLLVALDKTIW